MWRFLACDCCTTSRRANKTQRSGMARRRRQTRENDAIEADKRRATTTGPWWSERIERECEKRETVSSQACDGRVKRMGASSNEKRGWTSHAGGASGKEPSRPEKEAGCLAGGACKERQRCTPSTGGVFGVGRGRVDWRDSSRHRSSQLQEQRGR